MTPKRRAQIVGWAIASALGAAFIAVVVAGVAAPLDDFTYASETGASASSPDTPIDATSPDRLPPLESFASVWDRDLRGPLYDPPPPPPPPARRPPPKVKPAVTLSGIIEEPGRSRALLTVGSGRTELKGVGDVFDNSAGPVEVLEITADSVLIGCLGERYTLTLPNPQEAER